MFKEGDIIVGKPDSHLEYNGTNEYAQMMVISEVDEDGDIEVEVVGHDYDEDMIGETAYVKPEFFELKNGGSSAPISFTTVDTSIPTSFNKKSVSTLKAKGII